MSEAAFLDRLRDDLIRDEGLRLRVYDDKTGKPLEPGTLLQGHATLGIGRNVSGFGITEAEAMYLLENDMARVVRDLERALPWYPALPEEARRALANMCFQMGLSGLLKFKKMLAALERGDREEAAREALDSAWARQTPARAARVVALLRQ